MKNSRLKSSITYLFLVLFLSMKIAGLHVLTHTDDNGYNIDCEICDYAITNNLTPALEAEVQSFTIKNTELIVSREIARDYNFIISSTLESYQLVTRPPPITL